MIPAIALALFVLSLASALAPSMGFAACALFAPFALIAFLMLAWTPLRTRHLRIDLHADGIVVSSAGRTTVLAFDDVDEVWLVLDPVRTPLGNIAFIRALRLVDRDGSTHHIPTSLKGGLEIGQCIVRRCSNSLRAEAERALRAGETLTFGKIQINRDGIRGPSWGAQWHEVSLVRHAPGRLSFFRRQRIISWRSISLDEVPHPTLFAKLVTDCAPKVDIDDPLGTLSG